MYTTCPRSCILEILTLATLLQIPLKFSYRNHVFTDSDRKILKDKKEKRK